MALYPPNINEVKRRTIEINTQDPKKVLPAVFIVLNVSSTAPGRFRLYRDDASRQQDKPRLTTEDLMPGLGGILDLVFTENRLKIDLSPLAIGASTIKGFPCFWTWEPLGSVASFAGCDVLIKLEILQLEA